MMIELIICVMLCTLIVANRIAIVKSNKRRKTICWLHNRKIMLGLNNEKNNLNRDIFVKRDKLKMHNTGTLLEDEIDVLELRIIADKHHYFGKPKV